MDLKVVVASVVDTQMVGKKPEEHDSKRQRTDNEEDICEEMSSSSSEDTSSCDSEEIRLYDEELERHGMYDFDSSKLKRILCYRPVVFEQSLYVDEPDTDGNLINRLSKRALDKYNIDTEKCLEFVRAVKANWGYGAVRIFYITFEAKDQDSSQTEHIIPFHAAVGYFGSESTIYRVHPKPIDYIE